MEVRDIILRTLINSTKNDIDYHTNKLALVENDFVYHKQQILEKKQQLEIYKKFAEMKK